MSELPLDPDQGWALPLPRTVLSALPDIGLSLTCFAVWIAPTRFAPRITHWIMLTMLLEFIVIHSSALMGQLLFKPGPAGRRAAAMLGLGLFYTMFVGAFSLMFHTAWPLVSFALLTANRMSAVLLRTTPAEGQREYLNATWAAHVLCYLAGAMITITPLIPPLGFTPEFLRTLDLPGSGLWVSQPWRVVAFGAFYFAGVAACEWTDYRVLARGKAPVPAA